MIEAARELDIAIEDEQTMCVIVDCDCDGSTSAAVFINYMYHYYPNVKIDYILHTGKQHGLADLDLDYLSTYDVVICPDSASNDYRQHKYLQDRHT
jgi:single-stranded-DNA-specific exonuclease